MPTLHGQEATLTAAPPVVQAFQPNYPDTTSGLEHLAKDVMKAQKENDAVRVSDMNAFSVSPLVVTMALFTNARPLLFLQHWRRNLFAPLN